MSVYVNSTRHHISLPHNVNLCQFKDYHVVLQLMSVYVNSKTCHLTIPNQCQCMWNQKVSLNPSTLT